jgi:hypothetical protein
MALIFALLLAVLTLVVYLLLTMVKEEDTSVDQLI